MTLFDLSRELFAYLVSFREVAPGPGAPSLAKVRADLDGQFARIESLAKSNPVISRGYGLMRYALVGFADEVLTTSGWRHARDWDGNCLEMRYYNTKEAGRRFFRLAAKLDTAPDDVAAIFYLCLALGFHGPYASDDPKLQKFKEHLAKRLPAPKLILAQKTQSAAADITRLAAEEPDENAKPSRAPGVWLGIAGAVCACLLALALVLYHWPLGGAPGPLAPDGAALDGQATDSPSILGQSSPSEETGPPLGQQIIKHPTPAAIPESGEEYAVQDELDAAMASPEELQAPLHTEGLEPEQTQEAMEQESAYLPDPATEAEKQLPAPAPALVAPAASPPNPAPAKPSPETARPSAPLDSTAPARVAQASPARAPSPAPAPRAESSAAPSARSRPYKEEPARSEESQHQESLQAATLLPAQAEEPAQEGPGMAGTAGAIEHPQPGPGALSPAAEPANSELERDIYYLQIGTFDGPLHAGELAGRLHGLGFAALVARQARPDGEGDYFVVVTGPYHDLTLAKNQRDLMTDNTGLKPILRRKPLKDWP